MDIQTILCFIVGAILVAIGLSSFKKAAEKKEPVHHRYRA